jgi:DNA-binding FrmR family transcriptional regulator
VNAIHAATSLRSKYRGPEAFASLRLPGREASLRGMAGVNIVVPTILRGPSVSHTISEKGKLLNRVSRLRGQIEAVERALEQEVDCTEILQLIASARGAMNGLMAEVLEDHIRMHVVDPAHETDSDKARGAEELIGVVRSYLK